MKALKNVAAEAGEHVLMAGGGDGTISAAADIAWKAGVPLAVLPAGTMNLFARALKIPLELNAALESLASGTIQAVDISTANEESFVHQFSIGFQPQMIKLRNTLEFRSRWGKRLASMRAFAKAMGNPPQLRRAHGDRRRSRSSERFLRSRSPTIPMATACCRYRTVSIAASLASILPAGLTPAALMKLAFTVLTGSWRNNPDVDEIPAKEVELHFPHLRRGAKATIDGELIPLPKDVKIAIHAGELKVLVPSARRTINKNGAG